MRGRDGCVKMRPDESGRGRLRVCATTAVERFCATSYLEAAEKTGACAGEAAFLTLPERIQDTHTRM